MIVLFDGVCNLCNSSVQFILRRDFSARFLFASLQGPAGQQLLQQHGLSSDHLHSFVFIESGKVYTRSSAVLRVLKHLGGGWSWLYVFIAVPRPIRDGIYDWVARHRYRWFGRQESCWVPTAEWKKRFLDLTPPSFPGPHR